MEVHREGEDEMSQETKRLKMEVEQVEKQQLLQKKQVRLDELEEDLKKATEALAALGQKVMVAVEAGDKVLKEEYKERETIAREQQTKLEQQVAGVRKEVEELQVGVKASERKKLQIVQVESGKGLGYFLAVNLKKRSFLPTGFWDLGGELWGTEREVNMIYNRDWYKTTAPAILRAFAVRNRRTHIVAGSKGTGKTVFSFVLMKEALAAGFIIIYHTGKSRFWIVGENTASAVNDDIRKAFEGSGYAPMLSTGVYIFSKEDDLLFESLVLYAGIIYIVDIGDTFVDEIESRGPKVVISSPNAAKLKRVGEVDDPTYWYMPLWSWPELLILNDQLKPPEVEDKYSRKPVDELWALYDVLGGVPRNLFGTVPLDHKLREIEDIVNGTPFATWQNVFCTINYTQLPRDVPGKLVHISQDPEIPSRCIIDFASNHVLALAMRRFYQHNRSELLSFLNASSPSRMVSAMRGALVEECMHEAFGRKNPMVKALEARKLGTTQRFRPFQSFPELKWRAFKFLNMIDLTNIELNDYYQPLIANFPAVDAIALMERRVFDPQGPDVQVGVGFQCTVSKNKRKGVPRVELSKVRDHLREITNTPTLGLILVFVTVVDGINSRQRLGVTAEPGDDEFDQFVVRGISFEALKDIKIPDVAEEPGVVIEEDVEEADDGAVAGDT